MELFDSIQRDSYRCKSSRNLCDSKLQIVAPNFSISKLFLCSAFSKCCLVQGFHFNFSLHHVMTRYCRRGPTSWWRSWNVTVACTVSIWYYGSDGSLWVHPSVVINFLPRPSASNSSTTIQNPEGGVVPITVSPSGCLVGVGDIWLNSWAVPIRSVSPEGVRDFYEQFSDPPF